LCCDAAELLIAATQAFKTHERANIVGTFPAFMIRSLRVGFFSMASIALTAMRVELLVWSVVEIRSPEAQA
jgi:hypothetical protein